MKFPLSCLVACCCVAAIFATNEADFYSQRVQDWFEAQRDRSSLEANSTNEHIQPQTTDALTLDTPVKDIEPQITEKPTFETQIEEHNTADSISERFYHSFISVTERIFWTCIGWSIGVAVPVFLLASAVAYSKYRRRQAEKIQDEILADTLATRRRQSMEDLHTVEACQSEITPVDQHHSSNDTSL